MGNGLRWISSLLSVLFLSVLTAAPLSGCDSDFMGGYNSLINTMEQKANADEVNEEVNVMLKVPAGTLFPSYHVITMGDGTKVGQVSFRYAAKDFLYRAGRTTEDITGIWVDGKHLGAVVSPEEVIDCQQLSDGTVWSRWYVDDIQYVLICFQGDEESFRSVLKRVA